MVEDEHQIRALLYRLRMQGRPLKAVSRDLNDVAKTSLLYIDAEHDRLYFDELIPGTANRLLFAGRPIHLIGWLDGVRIDLIAEIAETGLVDEEGAYFSTRMPEEVSYPQRRLQYRVRTHAAGIKLSATLTINAEEHETIDCDVIDLSGGGVGLILPEEPPIHAGEQYSCLLRLPETSVKTTVEVCSTTVMEKPVRTRIGTRFLDLPPSAYMSVQRFIAAVQREQLRGER